MAKTTDSVEEYRAAMMEEYPNMPLPVVVVINSGSCQWMESFDNADIALRSIQQRLGGTLPYWIKIWMHWGGLRLEGPITSLRILSPFTL